MTREEITMLEKSLSAPASPNVTVWPTPQTAQAALAQPMPPQTVTRAFKNATRIQQSFTSALERRALLWLAARMPACINSDHLTLLGFAAMFCAGAGYALARWHASGLLVSTACLA